MTRLMALVLGALAVSLIGCSTMQNTPKQDYVWAMWEECKQTPELRSSAVTIARVDPDGRYWSNVTMGPLEVDWPRVQACMAEQTKAHPYLTWLKTRQASAPQSGTMPSPASTPNVAGPIMAPVWYVGDEWEYAYKSPSDSGTYVWSVNRLEVLDGVQQYVIKTGTREIFYRASDLAFSVERVDSVVTMRETPPRPIYSWPLTVGQRWEGTHRLERPVDRQTTDRNSVWTVEAKETVTVPAGTFQTFKIVWRNKNTEAVLTEIWYAPDVKQPVKIREVLITGIRERELLAYKIR